MSQWLDQILQNANIPSPPTVAVRLLELVSQADVSVDDLAKTISADPKLAARLIDYCNSPITGTKREVSSLNQAVMVLGLRTLRLLSLSFSLMDTKAQSGFDYDGFWRTSLATGLSAKHLAKHLKKDGDEEFLLGLIFNIGVLGIASTFPNEFAEIQILSDNQLQAIRKEEQKFEVNRFLVGASLLGKWNFPETMVSSVNEFSYESPTEDAKILRLAEGIGHLVLGEDITTEEIAATKEGATDLLGGDNFESMFDNILNEWKSYETLFNYAAVPVDSLQALELKAKESMMNISLGLESEIQQISVEKEELQATALTDGLTGLKNRAAYEMEYAGVIDYHRRQKLAMGVMVADIDHFKQVNDTYGHAAGDAVLKAVAQTLKNLCRKYDTVYRFGGEEFVVLVQDCNAESVDSVAERLREGVEAMTVETDKGTLNVTTSIGVCWGRDGLLPSQEEIFQIADEKLYEAKKAGRNRCMVIDCTQVAAN